MFSQSHQDVNKKLAYNTEYQSYYDYTIYDIGFVFQVEEDELEDNYFDENKQENYSQIN